MRMFTASTVALSLGACSFSTPLSGPADSEANDAEVVAANREVQDPADQVTSEECISTCRIHADNEYNLCRAQTPGNESNCALVRDRAYLECPGECG